MRDITVEDKITTDERRKQAYNDTRDVYDLDTKVPTNINQSLSDFFSKMRELYLNKAGGEEQIGVPGAFAEERKEELLSYLGVELNQADLALFARFHFDQDILDRTQKIVELSYAEPIAVDVSVIKQKGPKGITINNLQNGTTVFNKYDDLQDLPQAKKDVARLVNSQFAGYPPNLKTLITRVLTEGLKPNLTINKEATDQASRDAAEFQAPSILNSKKARSLSAGATSSPTTSGRSWKPSRACGRPLPRASCSWVCSSCSP